MDHIEARPTAQIQPKMASSGSSNRWPQRTNPVIRIATRTALIAALLALAACGTTKSPEDDLGVSGDTRTPPPSGDQMAIIKSMRGGLIGGPVGNGLSDDERNRALEAEYHALEYGPGGQAVTWKGDHSATYGQAVAAQPYRVGSQDCRQYTQTVVQDGQSKIARGTACRNSDGSWTPLT
jgi:surface antigen